ncbi:MAG TPA: hypothetical protein VE913_14485 [Longimicrobium sp.]|nr:hypothetical protein [Longimicrobium sp.]
MDDPEDEVEIEMDAATVAALADSGCRLHGFVAVRCADAAGRPLLWLHTDHYAMTTRVRAPSGWEAYTSTQALEEGAPVRPGCHAPATLGHTLVAREPRSGEVLEMGSAGEISILNDTPTQLTCGLAAVGSGAPAPVFAVPLYGGFLQRVTPLRTLFLFFSSAPAEAGTAIAEATGPGVLVDLDTPAERRLRFHINQGWSCDEPGHARRVAAGSELRPLLIAPPATRTQAPS